MKLKKVKELLSEAVCIMTSSSFLNLNFSALTFELVRTQNRGGRGARQKAYVCVQVGRGLMKLKYVRKMFLDSR